MKITGILTHTHTECIHYLNRFGIQIYEYKI
jgi:hypothetical protein